MPAAVATAVVVALLELRRLRRGLRGGGLVGARQRRRPCRERDGRCRRADEGEAKAADFPWMTDGYKPPTSDFIDHVTYDGTHPNAYIDSLKIGLKDNQTVTDGKVTN